MRLALLCALVPQLHGAAGDEERVFLWPLGSGYSPYELRATYGQPEGSGQARLHHGLDVSDRNVALGTRSRSVYALEDGVVERVYVDEAVGYVSGLVVSSANVPGRAWLYLHLEKDSLRFGEGEEVRTNQILGDVLGVDPVTLVEHLHLARLGEGAAPEEQWSTIPWSRIDRLSVRNPLALLRPEALGDAVPPAIETIEGRVFRFGDAQGGSFSDASLGEAVPASTEEQPYPLEVLACAFDADGGPRGLRLAAYRLSLTLQREPPQTFQICLEGPLPDPAAICKRIKRLALPPQYDYWFVLTNGAAERTWEPKAGEHVLGLEVQDIAENRATAEVVVTAETP